jgi:hypothetical protein
MSYQIFYWIHIVSYIIWLLAFVGSLFYGVKVRRENDAVLKRKLMRLERQITSIGAHIGALGILISGGVMSSIPSGPRWGWFDIQLYPWLTLKQVLFIIILVLVGLSIKRSVAFKKKRKRKEDILSPETSEQWNSAYRMSMSVYILVVINTLLGLFKPGLG